MIAEFLARALASLLLLIASPVLGLFSVLIRLESPGGALYMSARIGKDGVPFRLYKLRSMDPRRSRAEFSTTSKDDSRITRTGRFVRRTKLDEVPQLANIALGDMSFIGPRPNVSNEVQLYTPTEQQLLTVRPGITDLASAGIGDLGKIIEQIPVDADTAYRETVRPLKTRLALFHIDARHARLDFVVITATVVAIVSPRRARALLLHFIAKADSDSPWRPAAALQELERLANGILAG